MTKREVEAALQASKMRMYRLENDLLHTTADRDIAKRKLERVRAYLSYIDPDTTIHATLSRILEEP